MFVASANRYDTMKYNQTGRSGLKLPAISLGWWYNFGGLDPLENGRAIARYAFDHGVTHFDLSTARLGRGDLRPAAAGGFCPVP
jgi:L-glyceraldehyde 3-phosphate reductase